MGRAPVSSDCKLREGFPSQPVSFSMKPSPLAVCSLSHAALDGMGEFTAVNATALYKSIRESE